MEDTGSLSVVVRVDPDFSVRARSHPKPQRPDPVSVFSADVAAIPDITAVRGRGVIEGRDVMPSETRRFGDLDLTVRRLGHPALSTQQCAVLQTLAAIVALADACATTWLLAAAITACLTLARPLGTGVR
ncbi:hypothetical protein [Nocardia sp. CA-120079]|uniref:hypothetical protein n=1 Tax=Nocardia sp. CA-120079 TaxID=3239974 RepID=UPI003D968393